MSDRHEALKATRQSNNISQEVLQKAGKQLLQSRLQHVQQAVPCADAAGEQGQGGPGGGRNVTSISGAVAAFM